MYANGAVELYHDNSTRLTTTAAGVEIGGNLSTASASNFIINAGGTSGTAANFLARCGSENAIVATANGSVELYYDNSKKFETTSSGIQVTNDINLLDNGKLVFGNGIDLQIYHDGTNNHIKAANSHNIYIQGDDVAILNEAGNQTSIWCNSGTSVELMYANSKKFETTSAGVTVTGTISDSKGDLRSLTNTTVSSAYTLVASDAGKYVLMQGSGGNITVPGGVFSAGQMVTFINHMTSDLTIIKPTNMYYTADGSNANRTLAGKGMATIIFTDANSCYISGAGLS